MLYISVLNRGDRMKKRTNRLRLFLLKVTSCQWNSPELKFLIILCICTCPSQPRFDQKELFSVPDVTGVATEMTADICWTVSQLCLHSVTPEHRSDKKPNKELRLTSVWTKPNLPSDSAARARSTKGSCLFAWEGILWRGGFGGLKSWWMWQKLSPNQPTESCYAWLPHVTFACWF